jgi:hypothetical protein
MLEFSGYVSDTLHWCMNHASGPCSIIHNGSRGEFNGSRTLTFD